MSYSVAKYIHAWFLFGIQDDDKMENLSRNVFVWSTNEVRARECTHTHTNTHTHTHTRTRTRTRTHTHTHTSTIAGERNSPCCSSSRNMPGEQNHNVMGCAVLIIPNDGPSVSIITAIVLNWYSRGLPNCGRSVPNFKI